MNNNSVFITLSNGGSVPFESVPALPEEMFRTEVLQQVKENGCRVLAFFALPDENVFRVIALLGNPVSHELMLTSMRVSEHFRSLTPDWPAFHLFEREIREQTGIIPEGHPRLLPVRRYEQTDTEDKTCVVPFQRMEGEAVHEVAVGPIHAGVIEPGHFRFQCMGEDVFALEIALGYQHRGIEKLLEGGPDRLSLHRIETAAGDTTAASASLYCRLLESLSGCTVPESVQKLRMIALELERIANHVGDLGALAGDVAFLPTSSFCGRIRGEYLNMTAELCGNRFGRGLIQPGTCRYPLEKTRAEKILNWINRVYPELRHALKLMFDSPTVLDRLENTGAVSKETAVRIGLVGPAARASGLKLDARRDFPENGAVQPPPLVLPDDTGDVMARARIRRRELAASHAWLLSALQSVDSDLAMPEAVPLTLQPGRIAAAVEEAWRGELCHVAVTDQRGCFRKYKIVDPSFHNWFGLALALRGEQISNFPICNKSFNLSYCGHDL